MNDTLEERLLRAIQYIDLGTSGLFISLKISICNAGIPEQFSKFSDKTKSFIIQDPHISVKPNHLVDYRSTKLLDSIIGYGLNEDEFFQLQLVKEIHLSYCEYKLIEELGSKIFYTGNEYGIHKI